jgi:intracellular multiplication protein IcmK
MQHWSWMMAGCLLASSASAQNIPAPAPTAGPATPSAVAQPLLIDENNPDIQAFRSTVTDEYYESYIKALGGRAPGTIAPPRSIPPDASLNLPTGEPQAGGIYSNGTQQPNPASSVTTSVNSGSTNAEPPADPASAPGNPPIPADQLPPLPSKEMEARDFQAALSNQLGLDPTQIRTLRQMLDERERAAAEPPGPPPKAVTGSLTVSLAPGAVPPVLRTAVGAVSSFVVVDATGSPWPVENYRVGNAASFAVNRLDGPHGSSFTIDAGQRYAQSNLVLKLAGTATPVVFDLVAGQASHDARMEIRVQGRGPQARVVHSSLPAATDSALLPVLDGIAPPDSKALDIEGAEGMQGWVTPQGTMLIRTPYKVVSPASRSFVSSASGYHVYEISSVPSLLVMREGEMVPVIVKGW